MQRRAVSSTGVLEQAWEEGERGDSRGWEPGNRARHNVRVSGPLHLNPQAYRVGEKTQSRLTQTLD